MTREESITYLETLKDHSRWAVEITALDVAISALKESKGDLISRQAVLDLKQTFTDNAGYETEYVDVEDIKELPSISSVENKGEWIPDHTVFTKCSCCGWYMRTECFKPYRPKSYHFCPNCGADMRGK